MDYFPEMKGRRVFYQSLKFSISYFNYALPTQRPFVIKRTLGNNPAAGIKNADRGADVEITIIHISAKTLRSAIVYRCNV